ncbi:phosphotransferase [Butyrivibrio sp. MC2013]|uniref:phosphotransferase n=1 Tax=Butyrivibrio sp. MC2013 TaxID=1280686 RepID=UPI0004185BC1|nr:phosphotransferase [Butyrivibrio sp. MC2013]
MELVHFIRHADDTLYVSIDGKVDSITTPDVEQAFNDLLGKYPSKRIDIDADKLEYISSMGLRCLLKLKKEMQDTLVVNNVSIEVFEIFEMTGFTNILEIHKRLRNISVDGCELIGQGANGKVYRLSGDTIVKVYAPGADMTDINRERALAQKSFVCGIPTAITFDVVKVGDCFGVVFELLNARSLSDVIKNDVDNFEKYADQYVELYRSFHTTEVNADDFPALKDIYQSYIDGCTSWYTPGEISDLRRMVDSIPDCNTLIHGDYHPRNIMVQNGELIIIDMGDVGRGHPILDFLATAATQANLVELSPEYAQIHTGMPVELIKRLWNYLLDHYFKGRSPEEIHALDLQIRAYSKLKVALAPIVGRGAGDEIIKASVEDAKANLIPNIDSLIKGFIW